MESTVNDDSTAVVYLIEDDDSMRDSLSFVLENAGYKVVASASPNAFMEVHSNADPGCLVVDLEMPGCTGIELVRRFRQAGYQRPFVIVTGYGTVATAVEAMRLGAIDFIEKPFRHDALLRCVANAVQADRTARLEQKEIDDYQVREQSLTAREKQVMELVIEGKLTKQIASTLGISTKTVEVHRSNITKKMGVRSVVHLIKHSLELKSRNSVSADSLHQ